MAPLYELILSAHLQAVDREGILQAFGIMKCPASERPCKEGNGGPRRVLTAGTKPRPPALRPTRPLPLQNPGPPPPDWAKLDIPGAGKTQLRRSSHSESTLFSRYQEAEPLDGSPQATTVLENQGWRTQALGHVAEPRRSRAVRVRRSKVRLWPGLRASPTLPLRGLGGRGPERGGTCPRPHSERRAPRSPGSP